MRYRNPVLPGTYPDPSVCRVGDDYYLVTSTFEWFPGVPIFHSRDLVHWRQLGHVLDRPSQLPLHGIKPSGGIYAPTLRHHDGVFYMITTLVSDTEPRGNFLVTATDPAGPWSEPYWFPETEGFDPSLFFDDDGRAWMCGTRPVRPEDYPGHTEIWLRELDLATMRLVGEEHVLWDGAVKGAVWAEGPHIYKVDGRYYLLISEGGTDIDHALSVARADRITGPYQGTPRNPVLTHRHLGAGHPIVGTGHADLVQTPAGEWWAVLLAMRPYGGYHYNLGRETFLTRVHWEDGWPVFAPVTAEADGPALPEHRWPAAPACDHFDAPVLGPDWFHLRVPAAGSWSLTERPGHLRLRLLPETATEWAAPSLVGRRQRHRDFAVHAAMEFTPAGREEAGLVVMLNDRHHIRFTLTTAGITLVRRAAGDEETVAVAPLRPGRVFLGIEARGQDYRFRYAAEPGEWRELGRVDGRCLVSTVQTGFTGVYLGMYASANGEASDNVADFDWFEYLGLDG